MKYSINKKTYIWMKKLFLQCLPQICFQKVYGKFLQTLRRIDSLLAKTFSWSFWSISVNKLKLSILNLSVCKMACSVKCVYVNAILRNIGQIYRIGSTFLIEFWRSNKLVATTWHFSCIRRTPIRKRTSSAILIWWRFMKIL